VASRPLWSGGSANGALAESLAAAAGGGVVGFRVQGGVEGGAGLVETFAAREGDAERVVGFGVLGCEAKRRLVVREGVSGGLAGCARPAARRSG